MPSGKPCLLGSIPIRSMSVSQSGRRRVTRLRREAGLSHPLKTECPSGGKLCRKLIVSIEATGVEVEIRKLHVLQEVNQCGVELMRPLKRSEMTDIGQK
jgi:hypothetical protein